MKFMNMRIALLVQGHNIPKSLVFSMDETAWQYCPVGNASTYAPKNTRHVRAIPF